MILLRAFGADGLCWLNTSFATWDEAQPTIDHVRELCPESKLSVVDLKTGNLTIFDRKPLAELNQ